MPAPEPGQRWGILGGTFDPVHRGHLSLGIEIQAARKLDGILLVPAFDPPHRKSQPHASFEDRVTMLELAVKGRPLFEISRIEETIDRPGYTLSTVRALKQHHADVDFRFVVGADNLGQLRTWHKWETVLEEIKLLVGGRPGADLSPLSDFPQLRIDMIETFPVDISSTRIRNSIRQGATVEELGEMVPLKVAAYIIERKLYR